MDIRKRFSLTSAYMLIISSTIAPAVMAADSVPAPLKGEVSDLIAPVKGPIVIDNDLPVTITAETADSVEVTTVSGDKEIVAGTKFPIQMLTGHFSKSAVAGDPVEAALGADITIGGAVVVAKGSRVIGHVSACDKASSMATSFNSKKKGRMGGSIGLQFDAIVLPSGVKIPIDARPSKQARIVQNKATGRVLGVNNDGRIAPPTSSQVKAQAITLGLRAGASAAGPFSFGAVPVGFAALGAVAPSMFMMRPVGSNEPHRRLKGMGLGLVNGLPGGCFVAGAIVSGGEVTILPGDQLFAEFKQPFSGPGSTTTEQVAIDSSRKDVHGQVMPTKTFVVE